MHTHTGGNQGCRDQSRRHRLGDCGDVIARRHVWRRSFCCFWCVCGMWVLDIQGSFADMWDSFAGCTGLFGGYTGLLCRCTGLFCGYIEATWSSNDVFGDTPSVASGVCVRYTGLFCGYAGLFGGYVGLFCGYMVATSSRDEVSGNTPSVASGWYGCVVYTRLLCGYIGLFCGYTGLFCGYAVATHLVLHLDGLCVSLIYCCVSLSSPSLSCVCVSSQRVLLASAIHACCGVLQCN